MAVRSVFALVACVMAGCHLADDPEPPKCDPGFHVEYQRCVENAVASDIATIGKGCAITPSSLVVKANADFMFKNDDDVAHVVTGLDGKLVQDLAPGQTSPFLQITAPGNYPYEVSGCTTGGTITVQ